MKIGAQEKGAIEDLDLRLVNTQVEDEITRVEKKKKR